MRGMRVQQRQTVGSLQYGIAATDKSQQTVPRPWRLSSGIFRRSAWRGVARRFSAGLSVAAGGPAGLPRAGVTRRLPSASQVSAPACLRPRRALPSAGLHSAQELVHGREINVFLSGFRTLRIGSRCPSGLRLGVSTRKASDNAATMPFRTAAASRNRTSFGGMHIDIHHLRFHLQNKTAPVGVQAAAHHDKREDSRIQNRRRRPAVDVKILLSAVAASDRRQPAYPLWTTPAGDNSPGVVSIASAGNNSRNRSVNSDCAGKYKFDGGRMSGKSVSGRASATVIKVRRTWSFSVGAVRRNLRRAGTL